MNISEPFIRRPIATSLLMLGVLVFGTVAYGLLPVAALPKVDFPTIVVTTNYPGASPDTMASSVAEPLEQQFAAIPGLAEMTSTSGIGSTQITLQFDLERNIDGAAQDVLTAINAATGVLPKDLPAPPTYKKVNPADRPVLIYVVWSDAMPIYRVDDYAYTILAQKLSSVKGVSLVSVYGQRSYAAHVQVNPAALAARGIGLEDVHNALVAASVNRPKGNLEGANRVVTIDTNDQVFNAEGYKNVVVAYRNGAPVRVGDIATVFDGTQNARTGSWYEHKDTELLAIQKEAGANTVQVVDTIKALLPHLQDSIPPSVHVDLISDRSLVIRAAVHDVKFTMMLTIMLVVIVIFIFLRTFWATIIPSIAVPMPCTTTARCPGSSPSPARRPPIRAKTPAGCSSS
jgi:multidrug efflux pump subunit AcrB